MHVCIQVLNACMRSCIDGDVLRDVCYTDLGNSQNDDDVLGGVLGVKIDFETFPPSSQLLIPLIYIL